MFDFLQSAAAVPAAPAFDANKEYIYEYKARAVTGIKEDVNQFSGTGAVGHVIIQHKDNHVLVKFDNFKIGQFNQKFDQVFEGQEFPVKYEDAPKTEALNDFYLPVSAVFENGLVKSFQAHPEDNVMSMNLKRALLSSLQLDLHATKRVQHVGQANRPGDKPSNKVFRTKEDGIGGECDTVYEVYSFPHHLHPEEHVLNVTKHRLYSSCQNKPYYFYSNRRGYKCDACPEMKEKHPFRQTATTYYKIKGQREDYTIERIYHSSRYVMNPFSTYGKTIIHGINMTMFLKEVKDISTPITLPGNAKTYNSLTYTFNQEDKDPEHHDLTLPHSNRRNFEHNFPDFKAKFDKYFQVLIQNLEYTEDIKKHDITGKYTELIHLLETLTFDQLMELFNTYGAVDASNPAKHKIFFDLISNLGTGPSFLLIKHVVENKKVDNAMAEHLIASYPYFVKEPTEKLVEEFEKLVKAVPHMPYNSLTSTSIMALGHMIHKATHTKTYFHHPKDNKMYMSHETAKKYFKKMHEQINSAQTKWERLVYFGAIQNMGLEESFPYMKDIVMDKENKYSTLERISALYSLIKLTPTMRKELLVLVTPIYRNKNEHYHLRIAAFNFIIKCKPDYEFMMSIGQSLRYDHSMEVQSYVWSTFHSMANFSWPCARPMREHAKSVLELIPNYHYGYGYSKNLVFDFHDEKYNYGAFINFAYTGAKDSMIPNSFHTKLTTNVHGWNFDNFEFGFRSVGMSDIKDKIFGPDGLYNINDPEKSVLNMFKRHPRNVNIVEKELQEIETNLKFKQLDEPKEKSFFVYFKALGQVVKMHYFDEQLFNKLKTDDGLLPMPAEIIKKVQDGIPLNFRKMGHMADVTIEIANELGMPLTAELRVPVMYHLKGNLKAKFVPGFFSDERNGKKPTSMNVHMDAQSIMDYQVIARVGHTTPIHKNYGFGFTHEGLFKFPLRGDFEYNFHEKKYVGKFKPTEKEYEIYYKKTQPFTYIHNEEDLHPLPEEKEVVNVMLLEHPITREKTYLKNFFGTGFTFSQKTDDHTILNKGLYHTLHSFITKHGQFFEHNERGYSTTFMKKVMSAWLYKRITRMLTPKMTYEEYKVTYEPDTQNKVTEFVETLDFDYSPEYHKALLPGQKLEREGNNLVYNWKYDLVAMGPTERKFHWDVKTVVDPDHYILKKLIINYKRSPIPNYDSDAFMACYNGVLKTPTDWTKFDDMEEKSELDATLNFGKDCSSGAKITFNGIAEKSEEQKNLIKNKEQHPLFKKCAEYMKKGFNYHESCIKVMNFVHTPHKLTTEIKYENIPQAVKNVYHKYMSYMQHKFYDTMHQEFDVNNKENHLRIEETYHPIYPFVNMSIYSHHENTHFKWVWYPKYFPLKQKWNPFINMKHRYMKALFKHDFYPTCQLGGNMISTFDNVEYEFPQTDCWQLLTKDATKHDRFTILYKPIKHNTYTKAMKAIFGNHKVEILSVDESSPLIVRIDGAKQEVKDNEEFMFWNPENPNTVLFSVEKFPGAKPYYKIHCLPYNTDIYFTGKDMAVKVGQHYRNRVLGLCGNFNSEKYGDLIGPDHCVYRNPLNFAYTWAVNADGCTIPAHKKEC